MDTGKVREFLEFSRVMGFRAAARNLNMSQSALSQHVRDLEAEVGTPLVFRGSIGSPNMLTPAGVRFVEDAGRLLDCYETLLADCKAAVSDGAPARIQDLTSGFSIRSQLKEAFDAAGFRSVNVVYTRFDMPVREALDRGVVDFAVHTEATAEMVEFARPGLASEYGWLALKPEPLGIMVGSGNPLAGRGELRLSELEGAELLCPASASYGSWFDALPQILAAHGSSASVHPVPDMPRDGGTLALLDTGAVVATEEYARFYQGLKVEDVVFLRVCDIDLRIYPFLVYRLDNNAPMLRTVVSCMGAASGV